MYGRTLLLTGYVRLDLLAAVIAPLEDFLVATAYHAPLRAIQTPRLLFAAFQPLRFARRATCAESFISIVVRRQLPVQDDGKQARTQRENKRKKT